MVLHKYQSTALYLATHSLDRDVQNIGGLGHGKAAYGHRRASTSASVHLSPTPLSCGALGGLMHPAVSHLRRSHGLLFAGWRSGLKNPWTLVCVGSPFRKARRHIPPAYQRTYGVEALHLLRLRRGFLWAFFSPLAMVVVLYASHCRAGLRQAPRRRG